MSGWAMFEEIRMVFVMSSFQSTLMHFGILGKVFVLYINKRSSLSNHDGNENVT